MATAITTTTAAGIAMTSLSPRPPEVVRHLELRIPQAGTGSLQFELGMAGIDS